MLNKNETVKLSILFICSLIEKIYILNSSYIQLYLYIIRPFLGVVIIFYMSKSTVTKKRISIKNQEIAFWLSLFLGIAYVVIFLSMGIIDGYGKNIFDTSIFGILINAITFLPYYIFLELFRDKMLNESNLKNKRKTIFFIIAIYTFIDINIYAFLNLEWNVLEDVVKFLSTRILPSIIKNYYICTVVSMAGFRGAFLTQIFYRVGYWIFPVLPNLKWITEALLNSLHPMYSSIILKSTIKNMEGRDRRENQEKKDTFSWIITNIISILIVWFAIGVFPIFPTVVLTGSMQPAYFPGDVVIVKDVKNEKELKIGDIIQFQEENYFIIHRIIDIDKNGKYITKGDNNNIKDSNPVRKEMIKGKVIASVPKIGTTVVYFRLLNSEQFKEVKDKFEVGDDKIE